MAHLPQGNDPPRLRYQGCHHSKACLQMQAPGGTSKGSRRVWTARSAMCIFGKTASMGVQKEGSHEMSPLKIKRVTFRPELTSVVTRRVRSRDAPCWACTHIVVIPADQVDCHLLWDTNLCHKTATVQTSIQDVSLNQFAEGSLLELCAI